jgi:hypothetical protein
LIGKKFIDRVDTFWNLHDSLFGDRTTILSGEAVIAGAGGPGKTQLAIEYAQRFGLALTGGPTVQAGIPGYSGAAVQATIDYCEYVYTRYGRFPAACGPFRTVLAYQAHRLDSAFYTRFYRRECI